MKNNYVPPVISDLWGPFQGFPDREPSEVICHCLLLEAPWDCAVLAQGHTGWLFWQKAPRGHQTPDLWLSSQMLNCCLVIKSCPTLHDPMDQTTPGPPVFHCLPDLGQIHVGSFGDTVQQSHPLSSPSPPAFTHS